MYYLQNGYLSLLTWDNYPFCFFMKTKPITFAFKIVFLIQKKYEKTHFGSCQGLINNLGDKRRFLLN